jgi:hypothetical protein
MTALETVPCWPLPLPTYSCFGLEVPNGPGGLSADVDASAVAPGYDMPVTRFFLDTSLNSLATLQQMSRLLRPDGVWSNLFPFLWPGGG